MKNNLILDMWPRLSENENAATYDFEIYALSGTTMIKSCFHIVTKAVFYRVFVIDQMGYMTTLTKIIIEIKWLLRMENLFVFVRFSTIRDGICTRVGVWI